MIEHNAETISKSRLSPYLKISSSEEHAICIYTCLQHRAGLYFTIIQEIEIAFRNGVSQQIEQWLLTSPDSPTKSLDDFFCHYIQDYLTIEGQSKLKQVLSELDKNYDKRVQKYHLKVTKKAKKNNSLCPNKEEITKQVPKYDHNDIISRLNFGFWVYLLNPDSIYASYWDRIFSNIFDNRFATTKNLFIRMRNVLRFRNNLYHQEPVWKNNNINTPIKALQNLNTKFNNFIQDLQHISPERAIIFNESYKINKIKNQLFNEEKFLSEIDTLQIKLISKKEERDKEK